MLKRAVDIVLSTLALIGFAPLLAIISVLLLASNGTPFFKQTRIGLNGRHFRMYKFVTMRRLRHDEFQLAHELGVMKSQGRIYKDPRDPRLTRVGRILRRLSLDELPQLINVLAGDMSIVGPRPLLPHMLDPSNLQHRERLQVRPGITGLWQIRARAENSSVDDMLTHDLEYVKRNSVVLDAQICLLTIPSIILGKGAI